MSKPSQRWIAVLGRRDEPTDALEDYCRRMAGALAEKECSMDLARVAWAEQGWRPALRGLDETIAAAKPTWAIVQYTALSWSRRGFPFRFVNLVRRVKRAGVNVAIVFHDPFPFGGLRLRDRLRATIQLAAMQRSALAADRIISTISPDCIPWMSKISKTSRGESIRRKTALVPVGSNVCAPSPRGDARAHREGPPSVAVFGVTGYQRDEAALIANVVSAAAQQAGPLRLVVFGRGAKLAEPVLLSTLQGSRVQLSVFDVLTPGEAGTVLAGADLQLFVRSGISSRRGSAIAGITCGLPVVGFSGPETAFPITEAGVRLVPLGNEELRESLSAVSRAASERYFSWNVLADKYLSFLQPD